MMLGGNIDTHKRLLKKESNLQLVHRSCHQDKTNSERNNIIKLYRSTRKKFLTGPLKNHALEELTLISHKTILELYEDHNLLRFFEGSAQKQVEKMYKMTKKALKSNKARATRKLNKP